MKNIKSLGIFCLLSALALYSAIMLEVQYNMKMSQDITWEIKTSGLFCKKEVLVTEVTNSNGDITLLELDGIKLKGDETIYLAVNISTMRLSEGDSVYVVNYNVFEGDSLTDSNTVLLNTMPSTESIKEVMPPTYFARRAAWIITLFLLSWTLTIWLVPPKN